MEKVRHRAARTQSMLLVSYRRNPFLFVVRVVAVVAVVYFIAFVRSFWDPDTLLLVLLFIGLMFGHLSAFAKRFVPFMGLLFVYDSMRSIVPFLNHRLNIWL